MNHFAVGILSFFILLSVNFTSAQEVTSKQKRQVKLIANTIDKAGRLYSSGKYKSAADKINTAHQQILSIAATAGEDLMELLADEHTRLKKAHELLSDKEDVQLVALAELPEPMSASTGTISFSKDIAPVLVSKCGRCHVSQNRGEFSAANYDSLMSSLHVSVGRPDTSRIVEIIAAGDMPPNGKVPKKDMEKLKNWIRQGAKFDGINPEMSLNDLVDSVMGNSPNGGRLQPTKPRGNETVSFELDVAPILIDSCTGCHINTRRLRGNLNMDNFARLLRGGDSGNLIVPGKPKASLLIERLKGIDSEVMPPKRKLSDKKIKIIETWIKEGASFGGPSAQMPIRTVVAVAKANAQSHQQLLVDRDKLGIKNWKLIMSDDSPDVFHDEYFRVIGENRSQRLENAAAVANELRDQIIEELDTNPDQPFVKGNPTIYLFEKRYDLNELGMMLVGREIPKNQTGRWDFTSIDAYISLLLSRGKSAEKIQAEMAQQLAALHVASMAEDVPRWFADGVGYLVASKLFRKDQTAKQWKIAAAAVVDSMEKPFDFANGKLNELDTGLAGFAYVQGMKKERTLNKIMKLLAQGYIFDDAFTSIAGAPPSEVFKPARRSRR